MTTQEMKNIKLEYIIEMYNRLFWEELRAFTDYQEATDWLEQRRKVNPDIKYRLTSQNSRK